MNARATFGDRLPGISPGIYAREDFDAIGAIALAAAGISLSRDAMLPVFARLAPLVRQSGCATFDAYVMRVREDAVERARMIAALSANNSATRRQSHRFDRR